MITVLHHILRRKRQYQKLPLFDFLADESRSPQERLAFFPCMASFILDFGDLNRFVLRDETSDDPHQRLVNDHTYEDDHHWPWYLEDFSKLGFDLSQPATDLLRCLYGENTKVNRILTLRLAHLIWNASPVIRLAIIEAIEETGNVLFSLTAQIARRYQGETGVELRYCGDFHFQLESGHAMNNDHATLAAIEMNAANRAEAIRCADRVFDWFEEWTDELLRYALAHSKSTPAESPIAAKVRAA